MLWASSWAQQRCRSSPRPAARGSLLCSSSSARPAARGSSARRSSRNAATTRSVRLTRLSSAGSASSPTATRASTRRARHARKCARFLRSTSSSSGHRRGSLRLPPPPPPPPPPPEWRRPRKYRLMELPEKVKYWSDRVVRALARRARHVCATYPVNETLPGTMVSRRRRGEWDATARRPPLYTCSRAASKPAP